MVYPARSLRIVPSVLSVGATQDSVTDLVGGGVVVGGGGVVVVVVVPPEPLEEPLPLEVVGLPGLPPLGVLLVTVDVPPFDGVEIEVAALVPAGALEPLLGQPASSTQAAPIRVSCAKGSRSNCIMVGWASTGFEFRWRKYTGFVKPQQRVGKRGHTGFREM